MKAIAMATACGIIAALVKIPLLASSAEATVITRTYEIEAAGLTPFAGAGPAPVDPVHIVVTISFDNAADVPQQTAGITQNSSNLALGSALGFMYVKAIDSLYVGGVQDTVGGGVGNSDDWTVLFGAASTDAPDFRLMFYTVAGSAAGWYSFEGTATAAAEVPEPPTLALLSLGLLLWPLRRTGPRAA